jgi:hypothetical protein
MVLPEHGFFFSGYCEREIGSLCGLGCLTGYYLVSGDSFRECQQDGTWTGDQPKCEGMRFFRTFNYFYLFCRNPLSSIENSYAHDSRMFARTE